MDHQLRRHLHLLDIPALFGLQHVSRLLCGRRKVPPWIFNVTFQRPSPALSGDALGHHPRRPVHQQHVDRDRDMVLHEALL